MSGPEHLGSSATAVQTSPTRDVKDIMDPQRLLSATDQPWGKPWLGAAPESLTHVVACLWILVYVEKCTRDITPRARHACGLGSSCVCWALQDRISRGCCGLPLHAQVCDERKLLSVQLCAWATSRTHQSNCTSQFGALPAHAHSRNA